MNVLISQRHILWSLIKKELKTKYIGSLLGVWWSVVTPLLIMATVTFIFTKIIKVNIENFSLFSLAGLLPWFFFSVSLSESSVSIIQKAQLLRQYNLPVEFIPLSVVCANFINFVFGLIFIIPIFCLFNIQVTKTLLGLPLVLLAHLFFVAGLGLVVACVNVFVRDLSHLLGTILLFWFWITPIFYSIDMVPDPVRWMYNCNAMVFYIRIYRDILLFGQFPGAHLWGVAIFLGLVTFGAGYLFFLSRKKYFLKEL
ncbi:MAG: ABC transporter permease [Candidatus Omnitrophica bacterium]|nr:ABC transporter permease [Candidatus Omnitrophota bacterium]